MNNHLLEKIYKDKLLPKSINLKIKDVLDEDSAYAADELVVLSEEILLQLAAMGFALYINQKNQKDVYNDFLIELFTTKAHSYNAGPLFRWAAHMIKDLNSQEINLIKPLFWSFNVRLQTKLYFS